MSRLLVASFMAFALNWYCTALAQQKQGEAAAAKAAVKVLAENDKVRVFEIIFAPGAVNPSPPSTSVRVVRALQPATLERTYADGTTERTSFKAGEVWVSEPGPAYTNKNVGNSEVTLYVVQVK